MSVTLVATRGIPGSGKTTWARAWVAESPEDRARCNRDDLRANLFGRPRLSFPEEQVITTAQQATVETLLRAARSEDVIRRMASKAQVRPDGSLPALPDFDADAERRARDLAANAPAAYVDPGTGERAWLFDIDGTLATMNGRGPYDWIRVLEDDVVESVAHAARAHYAAGDKVIVMSGRDGSCRADTDSWLKRHSIPFDYLFMRSAGDNRKDSLIKAELFDREVRGRFRVQAVYDDRDQVVAMWRAMGLPCFQVAPGAF